MSKVNWEDLEFFFQEHSELIHGTSKQLTSLWNKQLDLLNNITGLQKTVDQWINCWDTFKTELISKAMNTNTELRALERRYLGLINGEKVAGESLGCIKFFDNNEKLMMLGWEYMTDFFEKNLDMLKFPRNDLWDKEVKLLNSLTGLNKDATEWLNAWLYCKWRVRCRQVQLQELTELDRRILTLCEQENLMKEPLQNDQAKINYEENDPIEIKSEIEEEISSNELNSSKLYFDNKFSSEYDINDSVDLNDLSNRNQIKYVSNEEFTIDVKSEPESEEEAHNFDEMHSIKNSSELYFQEEGNSSNSINDLNWEVADDFSELQKECVHLDILHQHTRSQVLPCWEYLILFFEKHPYMVHNPYITKESTILWEEGCKLLNHTCNTDKTPALWRRHWGYFKWKYRKRLIEKQEMREELTEIEKKFLKITGQMYTNGEKLSDKYTDHLLSFFEMHPDFGMRDVESSIWIKEVKVLNSICSKYTIKTPQQWFKTWRQTKWLLKKNVLQKMKSNIPLNSLDQRIWRLINSTENKVVKSPQQELLPCYKHLIIFFEKYPHMVHNPSITEQNRLLWEEEVKVLNEIYDTDKTPSLWRKHWSSFKWKYRKKLIEKQDAKEQLSEFESKFLMIVGNSKNVGEKLSDKYKERLLTFFEKNPDFDTRRDFESGIWLDEVKALNSICNKYKIKTSKQWLKTWSHIKWELKKCCLQKIKSSMPLTDSDQRILTILRNVESRVNSADFMKVDWWDLEFFFQEHPELIDGTSEKSKDLWKEQLDLLNNITGLNKTVSQWMSSWDSFKASIISREKNPKSGLKPLDRRYLALISGEKIDEASLGGIQFFNNDENLMMLSWENMTAFFERYPNVLKHPRIRRRIELWEHEVIRLNSLTGLNKDMTQWAQAWLYCKWRVRCRQAQLQELTDLDKRILILCDDRKETQQEGIIQNDEDVVSNDSIVTKSEPEIDDENSFNEYKRTKNASDVYFETELESDSINIPSTSSVIDSSNEHKHSILLKQEKDCNMDLSRTNKMYLNNELTIESIETESEDNEQEDNFNSIEIFSELCSQKGKEFDSYPSTSKEFELDDSVNCSVNNLYCEVSDDFLEIKEESDKLDVDLPQQNARKVLSCWEHLLIFFEKHPHMVHNPLNIKQNRLLWEEEVKILNKLSKTKRTAKNWRTCWVAFAQKCRRRITGKQNRNEQLTEFEKRFLTVVEEDKNYRKTIINKYRDHLLAFFERHPDFDPRRDFANSIWVDQVKALNALSGNYQSKTGSQWFKIWSTFKWEYKRKLLQKLKSKIPLSDSDRRVWKIVNNSKCKNTPMGVISIDHWKKLQVFFQEHPELMHNSSDESKDLWKKQLNLLNSATGLKKTAEEWMSCWNSFKARIMQRAMNREKPLSLLERRYRMIINDSKGVDERLRKEIPPNKSNVVKYEEDDISNESLEIKSEPESEFEEANNFNDFNSKIKDHSNPTAIKLEEENHFNNITSFSDESGDDSLDYISSEEKEEEKDLKCVLKESESKILPCWNHLLKFFEKHPHMVHHRLNTEANRLLWEKEVKILNKISFRQKTSKNWRKYWSCFKRRFQKNLIQKQNRNEQLTNFEKKFLKIVVEKKQNDGDQVTCKYAERLLAFFEKHPDFNTRRHFSNYYWTQEVKALNAICGKYKTKTRAQWLKIWSIVKGDFKRSYLHKIKSNIPLTESDERIWRIITNSEKKIVKQPEKNCMTTVQWRKLELFFQEHLELIHNHSEEFKDLWGEHTDSLNNITGVNKIADQWMSHWSTFKTRVIIRSKDPSRRLTALEQRYLTLINGEQVSRGLQFFDNKEELMMLSWEHMTEFFERNPDMLKFRRTKADFEMWDEKVAILNTLTGLNKTASQWIQAWVECKWQAKRRRDQLGEGDLTDLDKRILALCEVDSLTKQTSFQYEEDGVSNESLEIKSNPEFEEDNSFNDLNTKINNSSKLYFPNKIQNNASTFENDLSIRSVKQEHEKASVNIDKVSSILVDADNEDNYDDLHLAKKRKFNLSEHDNDPSCSNYIEEDELSHNSINHLKREVLDEYNQLEENENLDIELYMHTKRDSLTCWEHLLTFFENQLHMVNSPLNSKQNLSLWREEVKVLNEINDSKKSCKQWRRLWTIFQSKCKKRIGEKQIRKEQLTEFENRFLAVIETRKHGGKIELFSCWEHLFLFFEEHPDLIHFIPPDAESKLLWEEEAKILNEITDSDKTPREWRRQWSVFKTKTRKKITQKQNANEVLTDFEVNFLKIVGYEKVDSKTITNKCAQHLLTFFEKYPKFDVRRHAGSAAWADEVKTLNFICKNFKKKTSKQWLKTWSHLKWELKRDFLRKIKLNIPLSDSDRRNWRIINKKNVESGNTSDINISMVHWRKLEIFFEMHPDLVHGASYKSMHVWYKHMNSLNNITGLNKTAEQWMTCWKNFKNRIMLRGANAPLISLEQRYLAIINGKEVEDRLIGGLKFFDNNEELKMKSWEHLATFFERNPKILIYSRTKLVIDMWQKQAKALNALTGLNKDVKDWMRVWLSCKLEVRRRRSQLKQLTDLDKRILALCEVDGLMKEIHPEDQMSETDDISNESIEIKSELEEDLKVCIPKKKIINNASTIPLEEKNTFNDLNRKIKKSATVYFPNNKKSISPKNDKFEKENDSINTTTNILLNNLTSAPKNSIPSFLLKYNDSTDSYNIIEIKSESDEESTSISNEQQPSTSFKNNSQDDLHETGEENELIDPGLPESSLAQFSFWENVVRHFEENPEFAEFDNLYEDPKFRMMLQRSDVNYNQEQWKREWFSYRTALRSKIETTTSKLTELEVRFAGILGYKRPNLKVISNIIKEEIEDDKMEIKEELIEDEPILKNNNIQQLFKSSGLKGVKKKNTNSQSDLKFGLKFRSVLKQRFQTVIESGIVNDIKYEVCWKNLLNFFKKYPKFILPLSMNAEDQKLWNSKIEYLNHISGLKKTEKQWKDTWNLYKTCLRQKEKEKILTPVQKEYIELLDRAEEEILFTPNYEMYWQHLLSFYESNPKLIYNVKGAEKEDAWMIEVGILNSLSGLKRSRSDWLNVWTIFKNYIKRKSEDPEKQLSNLEFQFFDLLEREKNHDIFNK